MAVPQLKFTVSKIENFAHSHAHRIELTARNDTAGDTNHEFSFFTLIVHSSDPAILAGLDLDSVHYMRLTDKADSEFEAIT